MYLAESQHDADTIWSGSDDGRVYLTRDGGENWDDVTPRRMPESQVNSIDISPHDPAVAYITATRYKFNDFTPMIYKTNNYGRGWTSIVDGIGDEAFARVVREDPARRGLLYAGTEAGMYVSFDDGGEWQPLQLNLPVVPVTDLRVHNNDLVAATQGRAFWILDGIAPLHEVDTVDDSAEMHLFQPQDAYRLDISGFRSQQAKNPPNGAVIYYLLDQEITDAAGNLTLEVLDENGTVIRTFSNEAAEEDEGGFVKGVIGEPPAAPLDTGQGMNRYIWNLRTERYTDVSDTIRYVSTRPYRVAPGTYQARLTLNGESVTKSFDVIPDPRHDPVSADAWKHQQELLAELGTMVDEIHGSTTHMRSVVEEIQAVLNIVATRSESAQIRSRGQDLIQKIDAWEIHVPQPGLPNDVQDRIAFPSRLLSTQVLHVMRAMDQDPPVTTGSELRVEELRTQWAVIKSDMLEILDVDLREFNDLLSAEEIPNISRD